MGTVVDLKEVRQECHTYLWRYGEGVGDMEEVALGSGGNWRTTRRGSSSACGCD